MVEFIANGWALYTAILSVRGEEFGVGTVVSPSAASDPEGHTEGKLKPVGR